MNTRNKRRNNTRITAMMIVILLICVSSLLIWIIRLLDQEKDIFLSSGIFMPPASTTPSYNSSFCDNKIIASFAKDHNLSLSEWPDNLIEFLEKNPEATDFVLNYPLKKDLKPNIDLSEYVGYNEVPLLLQWDERWGYSEYAGDMMGLSGCGPTCLSMVCIFLLNDASYTPRYIAQFATENGYSVSGNGSSWTLISEGGEKLGLDVTEIPLDEDRIIRNLDVGNPIICVMGPGFFTTTGHFIVMTEYEDGYVKVNDPNSPDRSMQSWKLTEVMDQIRNLWVCR